MAEIIPPKISIFIYNMRLTRKETVCKGGGQMAFPEELLINLEQKTPSKAWILLMRGDFEVFEKREVYCSLLTSQL